MCPPLRPEPIQPSLRTYRTDRASRDRKRKGRSFEDEMAPGEDQREGLTRPGPPPDRGRGEPAKGARRPQPGGPGSTHIDVEV